MKTLTLKLPESLETQLIRLARKKRTSKSKIVREALFDYFSREKESLSGSFLEMANDLAGCVNATSDLSFNKTHLKGYGK